MGDISIKNLRTQDELHQLISVFSRAFETTYSTPDSYLSELLKNRDACIGGAFVGQSVVGGYVAFQLTPIHGTKELYIYDIAVDPDYQHQGIGTKLMAHLREEARARGVGTIFVEAESEDEGAVAFYRALGGDEVAVNHFNFNQ